MSPQLGAAPPASSPPSGKGLPALLAVAKENKSLLTFGLLGFLVCLALLGKFFINATWVDNWFGISKKITESVRTELTKKVDSGYSRTFIFRPGDPRAENVLPFYAEPDQIAKISIDAKTRNPDQVRYSVLVDGRAWPKGRDVVEGDYHTPELVKLELPADEGTGNFHEVKFVVTQFFEDEPVIIKCVVLVYNNAKPAS